MSVKSKSKTAKSRTKSRLRARKDRQQQTRVQDANLGAELRRGFVEQALASKPNAYSRVQV